MGIPRGEWHVMDMQGMMSGAVKLKACKSMLIDEWKSSSMDNPQACSSIAAIGRQLDEALVCLGVSIADDGGAPWDVDVPVEYTRLAW